MSCLIIFLGNILAGDDSAGYEVYMKLKDTVKGARMEYLGTDFFKFYGIYEGEEKLIIVDAVYGSDDIVHFINEDIFLIEDKSEGAHFLAAIEALKILKIVMEKFPKEVHLIGIPAKSFDEVTYDKKIIDDVAEKIKEILEGKSSSS